MTTGQVKRYLRVSYLTVKRLIKSGKLEAYKVGPYGWYNITEEALQDYLNNLNKQ